LAAGFIPAQELKEDKQSPLINDGFAHFLLETGRGEPVEITQSAGEPKMR